MNPEVFRDIFVATGWLLGSIVLCSRFKDFKELITDIFKTMSNGSVKADVQNKSFEISLSKDNKKPTMQCKEEFTEKYQKLKLEPSVYCLSEFKDTMISLKEGTSKIKEDLQLMIAENNILSKTKEEYKTYIQKKRILIISIYNNIFLESMSNFVKKLTIELILGNYVKLFNTLIEEMFYEIYSNHEAEHSKMDLDFSKYEAHYNNKKINGATLIYNKLKRSNEYESNIRKIDNYIVNNRINTLELVLIGLIHDKIKENMEEEGNGKTKN